MSTSNISSEASFSSSPLRPSATSSSDVHRLRHDGAESKEDAVEMATAFDESEREARRQKVTRRLQRGVRDFGRSDDVTPYYCSLHVRVTEVDTLEQLAGGEGDLHVLWSAKSPEAAAAIVRDCARLEGGGGGGGGGGDDDDSDDRASDAGSAGSQTERLEQKTPIFIGQHLFANAKHLELLSVRADAEPGSPIVHLGIEFRGTFQQTLNFTSFPFDRHFLLLTVRSREPRAYRAISKIPRDWRLTQSAARRLADIGGISYSTGPSVVGWRFGPGGTAPQFRPAPYTGAGESGQDNLRARPIGFPTAMIPVERQPTFFTTSFMVPLFVFVLLSLSAFRAEQSVADRLAITLSLLLSVVAVKFVVSDYVPVTSRLTFLDKYVLVCVLALSIVGAAVVGQDLARDEYDVGDTFDLLAIYAIGGVWLVSHAALVLALRAKRWPVSGWDRVELNSLQWNTAKASSGSRRAGLADTNKQWVRDTHDTLKRLASGRAEEVRGYQKKHATSSLAELFSGVLDIAYTVSGAGNALFHEHLPDMLDDDVQRAQRDNAPSSDDDAFSSPAALAAAASARGREALLRFQGHSSRLRQRRNSTERRLGETAMMLANVLSGTLAGGGGGRGGGGAADPDEHKNDGEREHALVATLLLKAADHFNNSKGYLQPVAAARLCRLGRMYARPEQPVYIDLLMQQAYAVRRLAGAGLESLVASRALYVEAIDLADALDASFTRDGNELMAFVMRRKAQVAETNILNVERRRWKLSSSVSSPASRATALIGLLARVADLVERRKRIAGEFYSEFGSVARAFLGPEGKATARRYGVDHMVEQIKFAESWRADMARALEARAHLYGALCSAEDRDEVMSAHSSAAGHGPQALRSPLDQARFAIDGATALLRAQAESLERGDIKDKSVRKAYWNMRFREVSSAGIIVDMHVEEGERALRIARGKRERSDGADDSGSSSPRRPLSRTERDDALFELAEVACDIFSLRESLHLMTSPTAPGGSKSGWPEFAKNEGKIAGDREGQFVKLMCVLTKIFGEMVALDKSLRPTDDQADADGGPLLLRRHCRCLTAGERADVNDSLAVKVAVSAFRDRLGSVRRASNQS